MGFPRAGHARGRGLPSGMGRHAPGHRRVPGAHRAAARCGVRGGAAGRLARRRVGLGAGSRQDRARRAAAVPIRDRLRRRAGAAAPALRRAAPPSATGIACSSPPTGSIRCSTAAPLRSSCCWVRARPAGRRRDGRIGPLPASYAARCPGHGLVAWHLDLLPAGRYQLRATHVGKPEPNLFDDIGRWMRERDTGWIVLRGQRGCPSSSRRKMAEPRSGCATPTASPPRPATTSGCCASRRPRRSSRAWRSRACSRTWPTPPASPCAPTASGCRWPWTPTTERSRPHISRRARGRASPSSRASRD